MSTTGKRSFRFVRQPLGKPQCGHACVAMVTGVGIRKARRVIGHERKTSTKEIVRALRSFGVKCPDRLRTLRQQNLPPKAILKVIWPDNPHGMWHWVVLWNYRIYDPDPSDCAGVISSFLPLEL